MSSVKMRNKKLLNQIHSKTPKQTSKLIKTTEIDKKLNNS